MAALAAVPEARAAADHIAAGLHRQLVLHVRAATVGDLEAFALRFAEGCRQQLDGPPKRCIGLRVRAPAAVDLGATGADDVRLA